MHSLIHRYLLDIHRSRYWITLPSRSVSSLLAYFLLFMSQLSQFLLSLSGHVFHSVCGPLSENSSHSAFAPIFSFHSLSGLSTLLHYLLHSIQLSYISVFSILIFFFFFLGECQSKTKDLPNAYQALKDLCHHFPLWTPGPLLHFPLSTVASLPLLFLENTRHDPTSGCLHLLFFHISRSSPSLPSSLCSVVVFSMSPFWPLPILKCHAFYYFFCSLPYFSW